jgi:hypothetical protein
MNTSQTIVRILEENNLFSENVESKLLYNPSSSTSPNSPLMEGNNQLSKWKSGLSIYQIDEIFSVLERFNIGIYNKNDLFPSKSILSNLNSGTIFDLMPEISKDNI